MAKYTFEDIEILRQKSGISYEEAVNLLEYHNGSLARALVDLEKNGRLKTGPASGDAGKGAKGVFTFLYRLRLRVRKDEAVVVNLSSALCAAHANYRAAYLRYRADCGAGAGLPHQYRPRQPRVFLRNL